jgi:hypothetical protein
MQFLTIGAPPTWSLLLPYRRTEQYNDQGRETLPTTATEGFRRLQEQIQLRQRLIQEGVRPKSRRWGLLPRAPAQLSMTERFHEFDLLVRDYDTITMWMPWISASWIF